MNEVKIGAKLQQLIDGLGIGLVSSEINNFVDGGVCAAKGWKANGVHCGLAHKALTETEEKSQAANNALPSANKKNDLAMIMSDKRAAAAAVYTTNKVKGAPLTVTKENLADGYAQGVIVNSVNANTCNADGIEKAKKMAELAATAMGISPADMVVASTGVIGQVLPIEPIEKGIPELYAGLSYTGNDEAVKAIMTTDTKPKEIAVEFEIGGKTCHIGGMLKGSGMIHPNMATTLTFITSDVSISSEMVKKALCDNVQSTLNCVSVDGDMSTNDMCVVMANGCAGNTEITEENDDYGIFCEALWTVMVNLARMMARDGEGATKLIECNVKGADSFETAKIAAKSVIMSSLFKAAMYGEDANCGRIMCALGYADAEYDVNKIDIDIASHGGYLNVCKQGSLLDFDEVLAKKILTETDITIIIDLNQGENGAMAYGCDLTYDYVKINGDYRS